MLEVAQYHSLPSHTPSYQCQVSNVHAQILEDPEQNIGHGRNKKSSSVVKRIFFHGIYCKNTSESGKVLGARGEGLNSVIGII
jgi:hypothetical protein